MFSDPQFWILIAFIIFVGAIFNPVRKILTENLNNKINEITTNINKAEKLKNDAQQALSEIKKRKNEVSKEISNIQKEAKDKISLVENISHTRLKEQINKRKELVKIKIDQMSREVNIGIQKYIYQTSVTATINLLEKKLNDKEKQNQIDQSLTELNLVLKN